MVKGKVSVQGKTKGCHMNHDTCVLSNVTYQQITVQQTVSAFKNETLPVQRKKNESRRIIKQRQQISGIKKCQKNAEDCLPAHAFRVKPTHVYDDSQSA